MDPRFSPPAHDEQAWDAVHFPIQQRRRRIHDVAQPAVLQVHHRRFPRGQVVSRRQRRRIALVGRNDVVGRVQAVLVHQKAAQRLQLAVRHPREKLKPI